MNDQDKINIIEMWGYGVNYSVNSNNEIDRVFFIHSVVHSDVDLDDQDKNISDNITMWYNRVSDRVKVIINQIEIEQL